MHSPNLRQDQSLTSRREMIALLDTAILTGAYRYARQISLTWLAYYPGDLPVRLKYGQLLMKTGRDKQAVQHLSELCQADPEYLEAWHLLATAL
jgi:predicted Zn-dependent protease